MKQQDTIKVALDEATFYIHPFGAFTAARMTAKLGNTIGPVLGSLAPVITNFMEGEDGKTKKVADMDFGLVAEGLGDALASIDPDALEAVLKLLLTDMRNITFVIGSSEPAVMTEDDANEIFCQDLGGMVALAGAVVKANFSGFFAKLAARYGLRLEDLKAAIMSDTDALTLTNSAT